MLRVGIMLDSLTSSAWIGKVIEDIQSSEFARVELVILNGSFEGSGPSLKAGRRNWQQSTLFGLYERWDYRRNKTNGDALAPTDVSALLDGIPSSSVHADSTGGTRDIPERQLTEIRNYDLDVLFCFGCNNLRGGISGTARYGLWSFGFGDAGDCGAPVLFRELMKRNSVSASSLWMLASTSHGSRIIYQGYASTDQLSLYGTRNPIYWKVAESALRGLRDLDQRGVEYIESLPAYTEQEREVRKANRAPNGLQMVLFMRRYWSRWMDARLARFRPGLRTKWFIAIRGREGLRRFDDPSHCKLMPCPADRFYADPFVVEKDGKTFLFFEDFRYPEGRAVISCCELGPDGTPGSPVEVLRRPYHLSYPYVFEHEGEMYMIPETKENRAVELYRATNFPEGWVNEAVLLSDVYAVDATVQKIEGKFWMFAGVSNGKYSNSDELCLFYADALKGPWTPHRNNPVLSDVRRSRPAGLLFYEGGRLIRPSQDCGKAYGYALVFSEVLALNEAEYKERPIGRIEPGSVARCIGTHTYNRTKQFEVVDRTLPANLGR